MDFSYKFLIVSQSSEVLESISQALNTDFPQSIIHSSEDPQDAVDFCRANIYDLIIADSQLSSMDVAQFCAGVRGQENDNLSTGILILGNTAFALDQLSHVMFTANPLVAGGEYLQSAKILISMKD